MTVHQTVGSPSAKSTLIVQFLRFGTVGTSGFLIDTAIVYGLVGMLGA
jgi:putative flippase GtrA